MFGDFHFLRPWWLLIILLLTTLFALAWRQRASARAWSAVCDAHLLQHLLRGHERSGRRVAMALLYLGTLFAVVALAGPTWSRLPVPTWQEQQPVVVVLDVSDNMMSTDLSPNRLTRAKFLLHDLFTGTNSGQFALVVFTGEPFVVSPLTEDGKTIDSLLQSVAPAIMPVGGQNVASALEQGAQLIHAAGFTRGKLLLLTASTPDATAVQTATRLSRDSIDTSVMPVVADRGLAPIFQPLATAGQGRVLSLSDSLDDLKRWLRSGNQDQAFKRSNQNDIPVWRDEGRWFLLPAMLLLLPVFRRGWLLRADS